MQYIENPDPTFATACRIAKTEPTTRQWRKWKRGDGIARAHLDAVPYYEATMAAKAALQAAESRAAVAILNGSSATVELEQEAAAEMIERALFAEDVARAAYHHALAEYNNSLPTVRFN